jgi:hypothetical protein
MKKILLIAIVLFITILSMTGIRFATEDHDKFSSLTIENIEALAVEWEIEFTFCVQVTQTICFVDPDGYFMIGFRQYG